MNKKFIEKRLDSLGLSLEEVATLPGYNRVMLGLPPIIPQVDYSPTQQFVENYLPKWKALRKLFNLDVQIDIDPPFSINEPDFGRNFSWYQDKVQMETADRNTLYQVVEEMDSYDIIGSALDLLAEDATQIDPDIGRSVWVESENEDIRNECIKLFDRLGIEENIFGMVRGMCKYGDNFERIIASSDEGIVALEHVHASRLTRVQDRFGRLRGFVPGIHNQADLMDETKLSKMNMSRPWSFLHFRLTSSRREIKHGESYLVNATKCFRQLKILEDTLVLYRLNRASDKDVYYIDVGDQPPDQQWQTINQWRRELRKKFYVNPATGQARQQYNPRTADEDLYFPLPKGSESRVERLQGSGPIGDIYDVEHFRDKLFGALRISKAHLGFEKDLSAKATLASQDIRFARTVKRVQRATIYAVTQLCRIHLAILGYDILDLKNKFKVKMASVTYLDELAKSESWELKQRIADSLIDYATKIRDLDPENSSFRMEPWIRYIMRKFFGFSTEEINMFMGPPTGKDMTGVPPSIQNFGEVFEKDFEEQAKKARKAIKEANIDVFVDEEVPPAKLKINEEDEGGLYDLDEEERRLYGENHLNCPSCLSHKKHNELKKIEDRETNESFYMCNVCKFIASVDDE